MAHDLVIRNGMVIDGTGSPAYEADVAVEGGKIAAIGKQLSGGRKEIDARGKVVHRGSLILTPTWISSSFSIPMEIRW